LWATGNLELFSLDGINGQALNAAIHHSCVTTMPEQKYLEQATILCSPKIEGQNWNSEGYLCLAFLRRPMEAPRFIRVLVLQADSDPLSAIPAHRIFIAALETCI
jgi:hypothetical protein